MHSSAIIPFTVLHTMNGRGTNCLTPILYTITGMYANSTIVLLYTKKRETVNSFPYPMYTIWREGVNYSVPTNVHYGWAGRQSL